MDPKYGSRAADVQIPRHKKMEALDRPQIIVHLEKSLNYTVFDTKWIPLSAKFVSLGSHPRNTGALQVYEMAKGELKLVKEVHDVCMQELTVLITNCRSRLT